MSTQPKLVNVTARLARMARERSDQLAIAAPQRRRSAKYHTLSFAELEADVAHVAAGLLTLGFEPGQRVALLVRPGREFILLVFALLRAGIVPILIDPGMGKRHLVRCLEEAEPRGFIGIPLAQAIRWFLKRRFPRSTLHVTVGGPALFGGYTLDQVRKRGAAAAVTLPDTQADDPAAVIFTTGSTGPPKGVLYTHQVFDSQVEQIQRQYGIQPGEIDLPGFPLFGLFNAAMGVSTIVPDMDPTRPAQVDPRKIVRAVGQWQVTQAFGSPAMWNRVGRWCEEQGARLPTVRRVLSAGAAVPAHVLRRMLACIHPEGQMHTPYGATEALPVATISAAEVLEETQAKTDRGAGVCVGRRFPQVEWRVIEIDDGPLPEIEQTREVQRGVVGELIVRGPAVTRAYVTRREANATAKIGDGDAVWHRMGDVGCLDERDRFWYCGRKAQRVETSGGRMFTEPCEAIINTHPAVYRSALVGIGEPGRQEPAIVAEPLPAAWPKSASAREKLLAELQTLASAYDATAAIERFLLHHSLPVDIRHNSKIFREQVAEWAARQFEPRRHGDTERSA
ncbi:MAG: fatty acid CoA ligase family protein [Pirellulales bacterium]